MDQIFTFKETWKCSLYMQFKFIMHYFLTGKMRLPFIDSDLLERGAL
jgi:hypothetical protein